MNKDKSYPYWSAAVLANPACADCRVAIGCNRALDKWQVRQYDETGEMVFNGTSDDWQANATYCMDGHRVELSPDLYADFIRHIKANNIHPIKLN